MRANMAISADFSAAIAYKHQLYFIFKIGYTIDVSHGDCTAAEEANIGELIRESQCNCPGLHAAH